MLTVFKLEKKFVLIDLKKSALNLISIIVISTGTNLNVDHYNYS